MLQVSVPQLEEEIRAGIEKIFACEWFRSYLDSHDSWGLKNYSPSSFCNEWGFLETALVDDRISEDLWYFLTLFASQQTIHLLIQWVVRSLIEISEQSSPREDSELVSPLQNWLVLDLLTENAGHSSAKRVHRLDSKLKFNIAIAWNSLSTRNLGANSSVS